ncbi:MAG: FHA domain-containing protein [Pirellulales bacterium]
MSSVLSPPTSLWCADGLTASIDGPGLQRSFSLDRPFALVGASPKCDIVVPILEAAPVALYLHVTDEAIFWLDLSSPTGQWRSGAFGANGCLVWRGYHLALERIRGDSAIHRGEQSGANASVDDRLAEAPVFDVSFGDRRLARAKLTHALTLVGKSPRCRLRLDNRHVSDDHSLFYVLGRRVWVVDLLGREGTFVNGQRVDASEVTLGNVVTLGKPTLTMIRWRPGKSAAALVDNDADGSEHEEIEVAEEGNLLAADTAFVDATIADAAITDAAIVDVDETPSAAMDARIDATPAAESPCTESPCAETSCAETSPIEPPASLSPEIEPPAPESSVAEPPSEVLPPHDSLPPADVMVSAEQGEAIGTEENAALPPETRPPRDFAPRQGESPMLLLPPPVQAAEKSDLGDRDPIDRDSAAEPLATPVAAAKSPATGDDALDNPSLDRLILRHREQHRRHLTRKSLALGVLIATFMGVIAWASQAIDLTDLGRDAVRPAQPIPAQPAPEAEQVPPQ